MKKLAIASFLLFFSPSLTNGQFLVDFTKAGIRQYYNQHEPAATISFGRDQTGNYIKVLSQDGSVIYLMDSDSKCYMARYKPKNSVMNQRMVSLLNNHGVILIDNYRWRLVDNEPPLDVFKVSDSPNEFKILSTQLALYIDNKMKSKPIQQGSVDWQAVSRTPVRTGLGEYYSAYQLIDFAKQVKFSLQSYTIDQFEKIILKLNQADIEQLNRDAVYKCHIEREVIQRRYTQKHGPVPANILERYCTLFTMLVIIGDDL